mmetsp:Transcript_18689/g.28428  ORF Transcript_18689/g.28428 Transcript_18689/m.28428 type:complete len:98 (-) Transcript_18689:155-448(-)
MVISDGVTRRSDTWHMLDEEQQPLRQHLQREGQDDDDEEEEKEAAPWIQTLDCALMESNNSSYNFKRKRSFRSMQQQYQHQEAHGYRTNKKNKQTRC